MVTNECTSVTACFKGLADALEQYRRHRPVRHVQGYLGSHWMLASGNYLLRIAPAAAQWRKFGLSKMPLNATIGQVLWPIMTIGHTCASFF